MTAKVSQHQAGATQFRQPSSHCGCLAALATDTTCSIHNENSRWNPLSRYIKMILTDVRLYGAHVFPSSSHFEDWQLNLRGGACRKPERAGEDTSLGSRPFYNAANQRLLKKDAIGIDLARPRLSRLPCMFLNLSSASNGIMISMDYVHFICFSGSITNQPWHIRIHWADFAGQL